MDTVDTGTQGSLFDGPTSVGAKLSLHERA